MVIVLAVILYLCALIGILALCRVSHKADDDHAQILQRYKAEREKLIK